MSVAIVLVIHDSGVVMLQNDCGQFWCGQEHEWCAVDSSYYQAAPDCFPMEFDSVGKAMAYARRKGWAP